MASTKQYKSPKSKPKRVTKERVTAQPPPAEESAPVKTIGQPAKAGDAGGKSTDSKKKPADQAAAPVSPGDTQVSQADQKSGPAAGASTAKNAAGPASQTEATAGATPDQEAPSTGPEDARNTLIMEPNMVPGVGVRKGGYQLNQEARRTVVMQPQDSRAMAAARVTGSHPVMQSSKAPEIELVEHDLPEDAPIDSRLVLISSPDSPQAAAFRVLRHHVLERGYPQVIAVSGPFQGCGKTTTAVNLALALAECGRAKVLLVDGNLRVPKLAALLRFVPPWCFAEQLQQHREQPFLPWGFVHLPQLHLHVAAINPRGESEHRLDAPAFAIAMDRLRLAGYEHIVIDCPSVLGSADVNLIQDAADGVLLCARTKKATIRDIREAVDQLSPTKIIGSALIES